VGDDHLFLLYLGVIDNCYLVYRPNLKAKSDADILRDAKLEAMGLPPQDDVPKKTHYEKPQMAKDELISQLNSILSTKERQV